jgi:Glycosyltransferase family 87
VAGLVVGIDIGGRFAVDAITYLAAGERLVAGHDLYALAPGDRPVVITPPFWTSPFVSPPFPAVVWAPLSLAGEIAAYAWWAASGLALVVALAWLGRAAPIRVGLLALVLFGASTTTIVTGNVNGFLVLGTVAVWHHRTRPVAGGLAAVMAAVKLTPAALFPFLARVGRRPAIAFLAVGTLCLAVSILGGGLERHFQYLGIARDVVAYPHSLSGLTGIPLASPVAFVALAALAFVVPSPRLSFLFAVSAGVLGNPATSLGTWSMLLAAVAPFVLPDPDPEPTLSVERA